MTFEGDSEQSESWVTDSGQLRIADVHSGAEERGQEVQGILKRRYGRDKVLAVCILNWVWLQHETQGG